MSDLELQNNNKKNRTRFRRKVKFETETISKEDAQKLLDTDNKKHKQKPPNKNKKKLNQDNGVEIVSENVNGVIENTKKKKNKLKNEVNDINDNTKKLKKRKNQPDEINQNTLEIEPKKKKKRTKNISNNEDENPSNNETEDLNPSDDPKVPKTESIRSQKRKKYQQLLEDKKIKAELNLQQKCLNYLSQWKHSKSTWKFEKLKQIWIQQNMFDDGKIPDEMWETVVEYFNNSKGKIKSTIMADALKIIEGCKNEENETNKDKNKDEKVKNDYENDKNKDENVKNKDENNKNKDENDENKEADVKYKRARFIIQNLEE